VTSLVISDMPGGTLRAKVAHKLWDWGLQRIQYCSLPSDLDHDLTAAEACSKTAIFQSLASGGTFCNFHFLPAQ